MTTTTFVPGPSEDNQKPADSGVDRGITKSPALVKMLDECGVSVWYDGIKRPVNELIAEMLASGAQGLTTNPTIVLGAVQGSDLYSEDFREFAVYGMTDPQEMTMVIMKRDVGAAASCMLDHYKATGRSNGYASIEVPPNLADDTQGTIAAARTLWKEINQPGVMIKIPATKEGIPAIYEATREGINVNATLIFSVERYLQVMDAYIRGLADRLAEGNPVDHVASVASFFVRRVDDAVNKWFDETGAPEDLRERFENTLAVANSVVAYDEFTRRFNEPDFLALSEAGARRQRFLAASTGPNKGRRSHPLMYVLSMTGNGHDADIVNTMPPDTLEVLKTWPVEEIVPGTICRDPEGARAHIEAARLAGIPFDERVAALEPAGVASFRKSFDEVVKIVGEKA